MATFQMDDATLVKTEEASAQWECKDDDFDGQNNRCRITGHQWKHQKLYRSRKGRFYIIHTSNYQGVVDRAEWISAEDAARWLIRNGDELPEELKQYEEALTE